MIASLVAVVVATASALAPSPAAGESKAVRYDVSLGDSLAASFQPNGDTDHGYSEQLFAGLRAQDPTLKLIKLGCVGESTYSFRFGSVPIASGVGLSCGSPAFYLDTYPHKSQLAQAVAFLHAQRGRVVVVTIALGANDAVRLSSDGSLSSCPLDPELGCAGLEGQLTGNLTVILDALRAAAGPNVPIIGMTYYNVFAPLWLGDAGYGQQVSDRVDLYNAAIARAYAAAGDPVADVPGSFHNGGFPLSVGLVCQWTWFCSAGDVHPNSTGYGVIARAFKDALP